MPESQFLSSLVINKVESVEVLDQMAEQNLINDNELYLVEDPRQITDAGAGDFLASGEVPMTGNLQMGGNRIVDVDNPVLDGDGVNKGYVDQKVSQLTQNIESVQTAANNAQNTANDAQTAANAAASAANNANTAAAAATSKSLTVTLAVASWSSNTQTVAATGVTASNIVIVGPAATSQDAYVTAGVKCTAQGVNSLTFTCTKTPTAALTVNVVIVG